MLQTMIDPMGASVIIPDCITKYNCTPLWLPINIIVILLYYYKDRSEIAYLKLNRTLLFSEDILLV